LLSTTTKPDDSPFGASGSYAAATGSSTATGFYSIISCYGATSGAFTSSILFSSAGFSSTGFGSSYLSSTTGAS
jgi:hypothetical protein